MNEGTLTTVGAVEVDGCLTGYLYLVGPTEERPAPCWRYVEGQSSASYSHENMVILLSLIKSSLRVARWQSLEVIPIAL